MAMITSVGNAPWPLDCPIADLAAAGLPAPSKVRFKLFTLDHRLVRGQLGSLSPADAAVVSDGLRKLFSLSWPWAGAHPETPQIAARKSRHG